jgi:ATP-dependent RNA helicase SUPV3L1/SUV3
LAPQARGLAYRIVERLGAIPRTEAEEQLALLASADRKELKRLGVRIGAETLWLPGLEGRAQRSLLAQLFLLHEGRKGTEAGQPAPLPMAAFERADPRLADALLLAAGYRRLGGFAIRFERLEAVALRLQHLASHKAVKCDAARAAALELPVDAITGVLNGLGYVAGGRAAEQRYRRRRDRPAPQSKVSSDSPFAALARWR